MNVNRILFIPLILLLLQGCASTPEYPQYSVTVAQQQNFPIDDFKAGNASIPNESNDNSIDYKTLAELKSSAESGFWFTLAPTAFYTLNPQDLTYFYLGLAAEEVGFPRSALKYYNKAILYGNKGRTCKGTFLDECNDLDFPSEIHIAISRVEAIINKNEHNNRLRDITINIDKPNSFFVINKVKYKSGESLKLKPGGYNVQYYSDNLFSDTEILLTVKDSSSESITLELKNNEKDSFSLSYVEKMNRIGEKQVVQLKDASKEFGGIGIGFAVENNFIKVTHVLKNGPAEKSGLIKGDKIKAIDGVLAITDSLESIASFIKGDAGSEVVLTIERNGKGFDVAIIRDTVIYSPTMNDLDNLISWHKDISKQLNAVTIIYDKLDNQTSLYKATNKHLDIFQQLSDLVKNRLINIEITDYFEYSKLNDNLNEVGISLKQATLYNDAELEGAELYSLVNLDKFSCESYVISTKNPKLYTHLTSIQKSEHSSQYIQEYRDVPNSRYSELKSELREARYDLEDAEYRHSQSSGGGGSALLAFSTGIMQGIREDQLEEKVSSLQSKLRNTPRTIREEIKATYYPIKNSVAFVKDNSAEWMSINCNTGRVNTYKLNKEDNKDFTLYEGVRSDDLNKLLARNQSTKTFMKQWSNESLISLADVENEGVNYLLSTTIINTDMNSIKDKIKDYLSKN